MFPPRGRRRRARAALLAALPVCLALGWSSLPALGGPAAESPAPAAGTPPRLVPPGEVRGATASRRRGSPLRAAARGTGRLHTVPGSGEASGSGPVQLYAVEVEGGLGVSPRRFAASVERTLADPRGWTTAGVRSFRRTKSELAPLRVTLASPGTTDDLCAPLSTLGRYSCFQRGRAVLNARRWVAGATSYRGRLDAYRRYMVNHEVGHGLGLGHAACPRRGARAPVMLQQTKGLGGCRAGWWPSRTEDPGGR